MKLMKIAGCAILSLLWITPVRGNTFSAYELKCEYMENPLAVNTLTPKFSWKSAADTRGFTQSAYEIVVGDHENDVAAGKGNMWNTGKREAGESLHIPYEGSPLCSGAQYWWSVRVYDTGGNPSPWSDPASFSVGLLGDKDWDGAQWIAMEIIPERERIVPGIEYKSPELIGDRKPGKNKLPQLRKEIEVRKPVRRAVAYVSGLGFFDFYLNGREVSDHFLDPAPTDYDQLASYVPFDVTEQLTVGRNALGVLLGNGYVSVPRERYFKGLISYMYPKMMMKLAVEYTDGTTDTFVSDKSWRVTESPVTYSSIYGGEDYDATRYIDGWMLPGFDDSKWQRVKIAPLPAGAKLTAQGYPLKIMQRFPPVTHRKTRHGKWLYDLGQNFQGTVQLTVRGKRGQSVAMNTSELFNFGVDSLTSTGGYRGEYRLTYTIGEDDTPETWHPQFTYFGQRYVLLSGAVPKGEDNPDGLPVVEEIAGLHIRNSMPTAGGFRCSDELLNKTHTLIEWGIKGNMAGFMTDCPHREKLPWIEQLHLMFGSLQYNFDMYKMYEKMAVDMAAAQWKDGLVPDITPYYIMFLSPSYTNSLLNGFVDSPEWGSSMILAPWKVYEYYGDPSLVERHYDNMKRYLEYLLSMSDDYILSHGLGDWYDIGPNPPGISQHTSLEATATPTFYMDAVTMARAAELLGKTDDAAAFTELAANIRRSYNEKFFNAEGGYYDRNSQCANAIAYCAGMVEAEYEKAVLDNIVRDIRERGNALSAGDVGYNYVLRALEANGASDVIYDMNSRYDVFGYGYQLARGATALPETWDALPAKSHNHLMLGHLQEWFYSQVGGIQRDETSLAYKTFIVKPALVGGISFAQTSFESPYGTISTDWEVVSDAFKMRVEVPANTTATIWVPASAGDIVTESGIDAARAAGLEFLRDEDGHKVYSAGGGVYRFSVSPNI